MTRAYLAQRRFGATGQRFEAMGRVATREHLRALRSPFGHPMIGDVRLDGEFRRDSGLTVMASQHGLDSLATDVAAVKACLARVSGPAILVGHSYGGTLITHAGTDPRVAGLVYIAALAPDADETSQSQLDKFPTTPVFGHIEVTDGRVWLKGSGVMHFAGDLSEAEQKLVYATQGVPVADLFNQKVEGIAWKSKPSWYIVASHDRTVHPELQRSAAKRMGATIFETKSSHVPMLSQPDFVLDVIYKAASAVKAAKAA